MNKKLPKKCDNSNYMSLEDIQALPEDTEAAKSAKNVIMIQYKNDSNSILCQKNFPSQTSFGYKYTPFQTVSALYAYAYSTNTLLNTLKEYKIDHSFYYLFLRQNYPVVMEIEQFCTKLKSHTYGNVAIEQYSQEIPAEYYEYTKYGKKLSASGVNYIKNKSEFMLKMAQISERGAYSEKITVKFEADIGAQNKSISLDDAMKLPLHELKDHI